MVDNIMEAKKTNRWLMRFHSDLGIQEWVVKATNIPTFKKTKWWNLWNKFELGTIDVLLRDTTIPTTTQIINDFILKDTKLDYELEILNSIGGVVEKWKIGGCKILKVEFSELNMTKDEVLEINLTLKPHSAKLIY
jgi:hypothetical protein